jgi:hypothetical protein
VVFYLVDTIGMFLGVSFAVCIGVPRFSGAKTAGLEIILFGVANAIFVLIWTDRTPDNDIAYVLFLLGIGSGLLLAGISLLSTGTLERRFQDEPASCYFFLRQVGASLGVSAAAVLIDQRMTMHSSRLLDTANRLDPVVQRVLRDFASLIAARAHGTGVSDPGNYQLFQGLVVTQARFVGFHRYLLLLGDGRGNWPDRIGGCPLASTSRRRASTFDVHCRTLAGLGNRY